MTSWFRKLRIVAALCVLPTALACGSSDDAEHRADAWDSPDGIAECSLLTEAELTEAIGPHDPPIRDPMFGGCAWAGPAIAGGQRATVNIAVLPAMAFEQLAEIGAPVEGFGPGATYSQRHGQLWFPCKGDMYCGVRSNIDPVERRARVIRQLALLVKSRV
jgi:hypothetical protein